MRVQQALVAIGGNASRLKADGIEVSLSKPFLTIEEKPLLFQSLSSLALAGIRKVLLCGNKIEQLRRAEQIVSTLPYDFEEVKFFQDQGLGVHGLPWHTKSLLDEQFIFECGHGVNKPSHYQDMDTVRQVGNVVFSAFVSHPLNPRQPVSLGQNHVLLAPEGVRTGLALAHPLLIDQEYARRVPELDFNIRNIIQYYSTTNRLQYVRNELPPEFDIACEFEEVKKIYEDVVA